MNQELSQRIGELLNDPQTMEQIRSLTGMLSGSSAESSPPPEQTPMPASAGAMPDPQMMGTLMRLAPLLQSAGQEDDSTRLLKALRPFMHEERARRIDSAIRLLGLLKMLPLLKSSGLSL